MAILIDQNVLRQEAVFVDFFGRQAATTPGLASFHILTARRSSPFSACRGDAVSASASCRLWKFHSPGGGRKTC